jgi:hypothetical protein
MPLPITMDLFNHFFRRSRPMDYWNHFKKRNKLVFSFIQFIYKWKFIHFSNIKHAITRCKVFVNGVGKRLLLFFSSKSNPWAFREAYLNHISTKFSDLSSIGVPINGAHFVFKLHDQKNVDQCTTFNIVLICLVIDLYTLLFLIYCSTWTVSKWIKIISYFVEFFFKYLFFVPEF